MPTYVYRFLDCDGTIEVQQAFTDPALTEAVNPADGRVHPVKKVFTPVGVTFKGDGFYKTDSRGKSTKSSDTASKPSESASSGDKTSAATTSSTSTSDAAKTPAASHSHGDHSH